jgi:hypothetical protein
MKDILFTCQLIYNPVHKPVCADLAEFIYSAGIFPGADADHEVDGLTVPPVCRLPPPAQYVFNSVKAASPDKRKQPGIFVNIYGNRLHGGFRHCRFPLSRVE